MNFKIESSDKKGRYAVAEREFRPGEAIFEELPFVVGPKIDSPAMCLGCYAPIDGSYLCSICSWPMCGPQCETLKPHSTTECKVFKEANVKCQLGENFTEICPQYDCITVLRLLLAKERDETKWKEEIEPMQSHDEIRKTTPYWHQNQENVVRFLQEKIPWVADKYSEDFIHKCCGLLEVNAYECPTRNGYPLRGLYPKLSLLAHSCLPNVAHSMLPDLQREDDFKVFVRATTKIGKGDEILSTYTYTILPTVVRQDYLRDSKYFHCDCRRCADPTELGTYFSALKCTKCDPGVILAVNTSDPSTQYKCTSCPFEITATAMRKICQTIQAEQDETDQFGFSAQAIETKEQLLRKYKSVLHPNNAYNVLLKLSLIQMYGRVDGYAMDELPDLILERKEEFCRDVLKVIDVLEPGHTRLRGMVLYEIHAPQLYLARSAFKNGAIDAPGLRERIDTILGTLQEAVDILALEPDESAEGVIAINARAALEQLQAGKEQMIEGLVAG